MAGGQPRFGDRLLHGSGKVEEADRVGDPGSGAAETQRDRLMREPEGVGEARVRRGLLHRVEIGADQVLGERHLEGLAAGFRGRPDDGRYGRDTRELGRAQPAFAGDEAIGVAVALDHDRVQQSVEPDGFPERLQGLRGRTSGAAAPGSGRPCPGRR